MKAKDICIVSLSRKDYALTLPGKIIFALEANRKEVNSLITTEIDVVSKYRRSSNIQDSQDKKKVAALTLLPTMNCNLRCIYCYAKGGESQITMTSRTAISSLDALKKHSRAKSLNLKFAGGGEPFMRFEFMQEIVEYARKVFNEISLGIVTNGIFGAEELQWIIENKVSTRISFDGVAHPRQ